MSEQENNPTEQTKQEKSSNREATEDSEEEKAVNVAFMLSLKADSEGFRIEGKQVNEGNEHAPFAASLCNAERSLEELYEQGVWKDFPEEEQKVKDCIELLHELSFSNLKMTFLEEPSLGTDDEGTEKAEEQ